MDLAALEKQLTESKPRHKDVPVPELEAFFPKLKKGEVPTWKVRGLTGREIAYCEQADDRTEQITQLVAGLAEGGMGDAFTAYVEAERANPKGFAKQIDIVRLGSVEPAIPEDKRSLIVLLSEKYPGSFRNLLREIQVLTGMGAEPGKPKNSGKTPE